MSGNVVNIKSICIKHKPLTISDSFLREYDLNQMDYGYSSVFSDDYDEENAIGLYNLLKKYYSKKNKYNKKIKHSKSKKHSKYSNRYRSKMNEEDDYSEYDMFPKEDENTKEIYYYDDIYESSKFMEFHNLNDFSDYLISQGISLSESDTEYILNNDVIYTCLDVYKYYSQREYGLLLADTYGNLRFDYIDAEEKCL